MSPAPHALTRAAALALLLGPAVARAETPAAVEILKMVDKAQGDFEDLTTETKMIVRDPGQAAGREYQFLTISKGSTKRIVRFLAPGDVKGMGMLIEGRGTMYAFLPGFNKVRRLGLHVKNQTFMGSDASTEDMAAFNLADVFDAKVVGEEGNNWILQLDVKAGQESEFPHRKMWVDKTIHQITRLEDGDAKGTKVRTTVRSDYRKDEGPGEHYTPFKMLITDHRRNDHSTEMLMLSAKVNQKVPDTAFSQRELVRGQ